MFPGGTESAYGILPSALVYLYDVQKDHYTQIESLPFPLTNHSCAMLNDDQGIQRWHLSSCIF